MSDSDSEFFVLWASLREVSSTLTEDNRRDLKREAQRLGTLACSPREQALAAAVSVRIGARSGDEMFLNQSLNQVAAFAGSELLEALQTVSDLTCLGRPNDRWRVVRRAVKTETDPSIVFIDTPTTQGAEGLLEVDWEPDPNLLPELRSELRLQVGWAALELVLSSSENIAIRLAQKRTLRFREGQEPGWWERSLQLVGLSLFRGDFDEGFSRMSLILRQNPPLWARQRIRHEVVRYAPLVSSQASAWLKFCEGGIPKRQDAPSVSMAASTVIAEVLANPDQARPSRIAGFDTEYKSSEWTLFGLFMTSDLRESVRDYLGEWLLNRPIESWEKFPWRGRIGAFLSSSESCRDPKIALELIFRTKVVHPLYEISSSVAYVLSRCTASVVPDLNLVRIAEEIGTEIDKCPLALRSILGRRGIIRAAIDGSNVMWGGRGSGEGVVPRIERLNQMVQRLREAGYHELGVFVDAATRHHLSLNDERELENWKARNEATVVQGSADPAIIRYFLEQPECTEIVTNDHFREWRQVGEFAEFDARWSKSRRVFYFDPSDVLHFNEPLDRPLR